MKKQTKVNAKVVSAIKGLKADYDVFAISIMAHDKADKALTENIRSIVRSMPIGPNLTAVVLAFEVIALQALIANEIKTSTGKADKTHKLYNTPLKTTREALAGKGKGYVLQVGDTSERKAGIYAASEAKPSGSGSAKSQTRVATAANGKAGDDKVPATDAPKVEKLTPTILHDNLVENVKAQATAARTAGFSEVAMLVSMAETLQGLAVDYKLQADAALLDIPVKTRGRNGLLKRMRTIAA